MTKDCFDLIDKLQRFLSAAGHDRGAFIALWPVYCESNHSFKLCRMRIRILFPKYDHFQHDCYTSAINKNTTQCKNYISKNFVRKDVYHGAFEKIKRISYQSQIT